MQDRNRGVDTLRGFMISIVVLSNILSIGPDGWLCEFISNAVLFFSPAVFMFIGGFIFSMTSDVKNSGKLLFLGLIFTSLYALLSGFINMSHIDLFACNMWFIYPLLLMRFCSRYKAVPMVLSCVTFFVLSFAQPLPLNVGSMLWCPVYFLVGYYYKLYFKHFHSGISFLCLSLSFIAFITWFTYNPVVFNLYHYGNIIEQFGVFLITTGLCLGFAGISPVARLPFLTTFGQNSFVIYFLHYFVVLFLVPMRYDLVHLVYSVILAVILLICLGLNKVRRFFDKMIDIVYDTMFNRRLTVIFFVMLLVGYELALL